MRRAAAVPHYARAFADAGIGVEDVSSLDDLAALPFTTKDDLRANYPFGLFAVPREKIARIHVSSGTTGRPTVVGYTASDLDTWAELMRAASLRGEEAASCAQRPRLRYPGGLAFIRTERFGRRCSGSGGGTSGRCN